MSEYQIWEEERNAAWFEMLDKDMAKYDAQESEEEFGRDDSEEFRWEHEFKLKCERSASHIYTPINWSDCYEPEIMGRSSLDGGSVLRE